MHLASELPELSLVLGTHLLARSAHIHRLAQFRLSRADQSLLFECLPFANPRLFQLSRSSA
jgi:hypothetical protein